APQTPCSQPTWVPVSPRSCLRKSASDWRTATSRSTAPPLTVRRIERRAAGAEGGMAEANITIAGLRQAAELVEVGGVGFAVAEPAPQPIADEGAGSQEDQAEEEPAPPIRGEEHHRALADEGADQDPDGGVDEGADGIERQVARIGDAPAAGAGRREDPDGGGEAAQEQRGGAEPREVAQ